MVNFIDIHNLTLDELSGVVNLYPWYGAARLELCRRMAGMGADSWGREQFAAEALYLPDRGKLVPLLQDAALVDCADKQIQSLLSAYMESAAQAGAEESGHAVRVVGGDYFSQSQYDQVKQTGENIFSRFAQKLQPAPAAPDSPETSDIADRFATETLARIFAEQGRPEEARRIYSRLVLDIPEKSAYFASLIDKLE